jgi:hypothetical protein
MPKFEHSVEHVNCETDFCRLRLAVSASEAAADDSLVTVEGVLDSGWLVVACLFLPCSSTEFFES